MIKTSQKKNQSKPWYRRLSWSDYLTILGGVILFGSWIAQNKFQVEWDDKIRMLERSQLVIDIEEVHRSLWELSYNVEIRNQPVDSLHLAIAALGVTRSRMDLYTWGIARVSENSVTNSQMMQAKRLIDEKSRQSLLQGDLKPVFDAFQFINEAFTKNYMNIDRNFDTKLNEVRTNQRFWNVIFFRSYIIGSTLLGIGFILGKLTSKHRD